MSEYNGDCDVNLIIELLNGRAPNNEAEKVKILFLILWLLNLSFWLIEILKMYRGSMGMLYDNTEGNIKIELN